MLHRAHKIPEDRDVLYIDSSVSFPPWARQGRDHMSRPVLLWSFPEVIQAWSSSTAYSSSNRLHGIYPSCQSESPVDKSLFSLQNWTEIFISSPRTAGDGVQDKQPWPADATL